MKSIAITATFCALVLACQQKEDTRAVKGWPRPFQPRLTGAAEWQPCRVNMQEGHIVEEATCGPARPRGQSAEPCPSLIRTSADAVRLLADNPACLDDAIDALQQRFSPHDVNAASDLAAAYYVRAQRDDAASDLLGSLDAANDAVLRAPQLATARFNQALAMEALGLRAEALTAWEAAAKLDRGRWAAEARVHQQRLAAVPDAAAEWDSHRRQLSRALATHDRAAVERLIAPFPATSERFFEDELLPQWALRPTADHLQAVQAFGEAHAKATGNRYCLDIAHAIAAASPEQTRILRRAHRAYREARSAGRAIDTHTAAGKYRRAAELLETGGSPLSLLAHLNYAVWASYETAGIPRALPLLDPLEQRAREHGYDHLVARIEATREVLLQWDGRYVEGFAELEKAMAGFERLRDHESYLAVRLHATGDYRSVGEHEHSLREALWMCRRLHEIVDAQARHTVIGDTAATVLALGHPRVALLYQQDGLSLLTGEWAAAKGADENEIRRLRKNLYIAYRELAKIKLQLPQPPFEDVKADLAKAARWIQEDAAGRKEDEDVLRVVNVRLDEVSGQSLLHVDPAAAAKSFTRALALIRNDNFPTFRAGLLAQRAEAHRKAGERAAAERDLLQALRELHREETGNLERRQRGQVEPLWSPYFSRFQDTYRQLIRQLVEEDRGEEAFTYVEKARAYEPLNLILNTSVVPPAFRGLTTGEPLALAEIRRHLPADTVLVEFCVLTDHTYTFIVSRDHFEVVDQALDQRKLRRWTETLQRAARQPNPEAVAAALRPPSAELFAKPLEAIDRLGIPPDQRRLVFIPDDALYGLPFAALNHAPTNHYLMEDAVISAAGSATLYVFSLLRNDALPAQAAPSALLIDTPAYDTTLPFVQGLDPLTGTTREVRRIAELYGPRAEILGKGDATVPRFFDGARNSDVIHFAGHAFANAQEPSRSFLLLAPSPGESGVLDAATLVKRLQADHTRMVVLSACRSAGGLPIGPEGLAPLVRPLIGAGIPAVIGSLWNVQDATAPDLFVSFYGRYRKGKDAARALTEAQRDLLHGTNPGLASVLAWAPFEVIGYASSSSFGATRNIEGEPP